MCLSLLYRYRGDNLNITSTWLCSHNDLSANIAVLGAAATTFLLSSGWPDILVGCLIASLFLGSASRVLRQSVRALRAEPGSAVQGTKPVVVTVIKGSRSP